MSDYGGMRALETSLVTRLDTEARPNNLRIVEQPVLVRRLAALDRRLLLFHGKKPTSRIPAFEKAFRRICADV
ncbi:hypothetical protein LA345_20670 [Burkholderia vietnamiensis]|uniref:hypothetical protein n=1 Tax=Burkholderia vietnamiensis TaxID=60552 RepID=UPI00158F5208|nr:hypothetical protein [Burkholderia vietnamiensis]MCB4346312.1 hypothetical protein [Burkholderia vietnamiensis]